MSLSSAADTKAAPVQVTHQSIAGPSHTPPDFSHFAAEHFQIDNEDVVSHDPRLNTDGEALYRFLLAQSDLYPPWIRINLKGTHQETHTRFVNEQDAQGRQSTRTENYTETITDFDFCIDVHAVEGMKPIHWTVADDEPAYRGKPVREVENYLAPGKRRTTTSQENGAQDNWEETRSNAGLPPWVRQTDMLAGLEPTTLGSSSDPEAGVLMSSKSVREWADEYCASPKYLKEFVYRKVLFGWKLGQLETAMRGTISSLPYNGEIEIKFEPHASAIYIRPDNRLSRLLSNKWLKFLTIILLIYPFIWLFKRFHSRGGGKWQVAGDAWPLKSWEPPSTPRPDTIALPSYQAATSDAASAKFTSRSLTTASSSRTIVGVREGEWFRQWEPAIVRAVTGRYKSPVPLPTRPKSNIHAQGLDGYDDRGPLLTFS